MDPSFDRLEIEIPQAPPLAAAVTRELTADDLKRAETMPLGVRPPSLQRIRAVHHQAARLLATGMKAVEVSAVVGMSQSRISILLSDPAFKELVAFYSEREDARFNDVQDRMVLLGLDAAAELHERIVDDPEAVSTKDLIKVLSSALDRGGHAPKTRNEHVHLHLTPQDLERIRQEVPPGAVVRRPESRGAAAGRAIEGSASRVGSEEDSEGSEGEGGQI